MSLTTGIEWILIFGLVALLVAALTSPLESLSWWAGWFDENEERDNLEDDFVEKIDQNTPAVAPPGVERYIVYLTGIGGFATDQFFPEEEAMLDRLEATMPNSVIVRDIYPYSPHAGGLMSANRVFASFWKRAVDAKLSGGLAGFVINLRNVLQVLVAADSRYGPVFSRGIGQIIVRALEKQGYPFGKGIPITLLGYSGGGEISVSVTPVLERALQAPISIVSLGGVFTADRGIDALSGMIHLYGTRDGVQRLGVLAFPRRWRFVPSYYNQLRREGVIRAEVVGEMTHNGPQSYLDGESVLPDGQTYLDYSVSRLAAAIREVSARPRVERASEAESTAKT